MWLCSKVARTISVMNKESQLVIAHIAEHIQPLDRVDRYEDPVNKALEELKFGQVTGGGTQFTKEGEILFGDLELDLTEPEAALPILRRLLEELGAPAGSFFEYTVDGQQQMMPFGKAECTAI